MAAPGLPRKAILAATGNGALAALGRRYGMRLGAARFVAGDTLEDCIGVLRSLHARGLAGYAVLLGESVTARPAVDAAVHAYEHVAARLGGEPIRATMSIKLTHLGLLIDEELAFRSARAIVGTAQRHGVFVRLDMEESAHVDATLRTYRRLRAEGLDNTGVVLQAYLYRSPEDLRALLPLGLNVRIVKGAYLEPASVAFPRKRDVDRRYVELARTALAHAQFTAIATHDDRMIGALAGHGGAHELQLLYGVRPQLQDRLVAAGRRVRVCVPYGSDWFVYFGRRLAERPANLLFVARGVVRR
jgi:proline dehydrogenase